MAENDREHIPLKIKQEIGNYAANHGTKAAIDRSSKVYAKINSKCMEKKFKKMIFFHWPEEKKDQVLWIMNCCKSTEML